MTLPILPDAEALIGTWLRTHPDIATIGARVAGKTPASMTQPWIRVTLLHSEPIPRATFEHVTRHLLQLDCYAGKAATDAHAGQAQASLLARTARAVLTATQASTADGVVISRVRFTGHLHAPDTVLEPARERYILTTSIQLRPA